MSKLEEFTLNADLSVPSALHFIFTHFSNYGKPSTSSSNSIANQHPSTPTLDNANFFKFIKSCPNLLGPTLPRTSIDLIFTKCKQDIQRKINFYQFLSALNLIAVKKYSNDDPIGAFGKLLGFHVFGVLYEQGLDDDDDDTTASRVKSSVRVVDCILGYDNYYDASSTINNRKDIQVNSKTQGSTVIAGSANRTGGTYDRLANSNSFTGIYKHNLNNDMRHESSNNTSMDYGRSAGQIQAGSANKVGGAIDRLSNVKMKQYGNSGGR